MPYLLKSATENSKEIFVQGKSSYHPGQTLVNGYALSYRDLEFAHR